LVAARRPLAAAPAARLRTLRAVFFAPARAPVVEAFRRRARVVLRLGVSAPPSPTARAARLAASPTALTAVRAALPTMFAAVLAAFAALLATLPAVLATVDPTVLPTWPAVWAAPLTPSVSVPVSPLSRSVVIVPPRGRAPRPFLMDYTSTRAARGTAV
jgi:hypothetical protein